MSMALLAVASFHVLLPAKVGLLSGFWISSEEILPEKGSDDKVEKKYLETRGGQMDFGAVNRFSPTSGYNDRTERKGKARVRREVVLMNLPVPNPVPPHKPLPALDPADYPNLDEIITEDGAPVDSIYMEKQYRLLTDTLYSSWPGPGEGRPFVALANVGFFFAHRQPPLVPDCLLSLDVTVGEDLWEKENRAYFLWVFEKPPDVVIEIVSDKRGGEEDFKRDAYARHRVIFYVIFDPRNLLQGGVLRAWGLQRNKYVAVDPQFFPEVGLGLTLWEGAFEGSRESWLRWCDQNGSVIPTGAERADEATQKLERLAAQLRALGHDPEV